MYEVAEEDRKIVEADLAAKGIKHYGMQKGNNSVWVWYGRVNAYYTIEDGKIVDIWID